MDGYSVVTTDDKRFGRLVGTQGDCYIIERGSLLRKTRYPLPKRYVSIMREEECARVQVSKETLCEGPRVTRNGAVDEEAIAAYYGN